MRKTKRELVKILRMIEKENQVLKKETIHAFDLTVDTLKTLDILHHVIKTQKSENRELIDQLSAEKNVVTPTPTPPSPLLSSLKHQQERQKTQKTISDLESLVEELSSVIQELSGENEQTKADLDYFQCRKKKLEDEILQQTHQVKILKEKNSRLEAYRQKEMDQVGFYNDIFQIDEKRFILINEKLEIEFVSNRLEKQMKHGRSWNEKCLHELITEERAEKKGKIIKKIQSVLEGKKNQTLKSIYLKLSPLKIIKTNAKAVRTSIKQRPAVLISF